MIHSKVASIASGALLIYVQAKVCKREIETSAVLKNQQAVDNWLNLTYRNLLADTMLRFVKQRKQAAKHFRHYNAAVDSSILNLMARFENARQLSLYELSQRIVVSKPQLDVIMPPADSRFASWAETVLSAIELSKSILKLKEKHPDQRPSLSEFIHI